MKTILVSLDQHGYSQAVLETALILGRSFESYIEGFARGPDLHNLIAVEVPLAVPLSAEVPPQQMVESAHQQFETFVRIHAVPGPIPTDPMGAIGGTPLSGRVRVLNHPLWSDHASPLSST